MQDLLESVSVTALLATLVVVGITILIYTKVVKPYRQYHLYKKIVGASYKTLSSPYSILGLGNFGRLKNDLLLYNDSHYTVKTKYSNYQVSLSSFKGSVFIDLIDPELIRQFYERTLEGCYQKSKDFPLMYSLYSILGKGLLFSQGAQWKSKKRIMSSVFNYDFIKSKIRTIASIAQQKMTEIEQSPNNARSQTVQMDVNNMFQRIYGSVVIRCFFGDIQLDKLEGIQFFSYINNLFEQNTDRAFTLWAFFLGKFFVKWPLRKIDREVNQKSKKLREYSTKVIQEQIRKARENMGKGEIGDAGGLIERLVREGKLKEDSAVVSDLEKKDYYTVTDLIDQLVTFFMAGTETTSNMATSLIYMLAKHPEVEAKVRYQISTVLKDRTENITFEKLKELTYLQNVQKETLRMYSPTAGIFIRKVIKDHYIGSIPVQTGMLVSLKIKSCHHKTEFYDNPMEFNPDRWNSIDATKVDPFSYFPFSSGQRNCIGQHLALLESKIAVAMVLMRYSKITLQKENYQMKMRVLYGPEHMITTFQKKTQ